MTTTKEKDSLPTLTAARNCWKTAREKERRKARFEIRERVFVGYSSTIPSEDLLGAETCDETLGQIITQINAGDRSFFSLSFLASHFRLLSTPVPTEFILQRLPEEQVISWFGPDRLQLLKDYMKSRDALPLIEYSAMLRRYHIIGAFLMGGINPCARGPYRNSSSQKLEFDKQLQNVSDQILKIFFYRFPLSLSTYVFKRVTDMRFSSFCFEQRNQDYHDTQQLFTCGVCQESLPNSYRLIFTDPDTDSNSCHHAVCERCFWTDIIQHVRSRWGDVVLCPCCDHAARADDEGLSEHRRLISDQAEHPGMNIPQEHAQKSKAKFDLLPADSIALKKSKQKKKRIPEAHALAKTWSQAVLPSLGLCQSVRRDKFINFTEACSIPFVRGCLDAGIDVNALNQYGQTALYIAAWKGSLDLVELLLTYGADPRLKANGGLTVEALSHAHGHWEILQLLQESHRKYWNGADASENDLVDNEHFYGAALESRLLESNIEGLVCLDTLIDPKRDHPGAGSYVISGCIAHVGSLLRLWRSLPIDQSTPKTQKKQALCSDRSYFCDAEGWLREILQKQILRAFSGHELFITCKDEPKVLVLPHMRFLHYSRAGSSLAPHVDLNRIDPVSGLRSTHSFLLYLSDCEYGGETVLLEDLVNRNVLAKIKPQSGRLLLFPHSCPHEGEIVEDIPKLLIRGEVCLELTME